MDKSELAKMIGDKIGKAAAWTAKKSLNGALRIGEYAYDHRQQIFEGAKLAGTSAAQAAKGFGQSIYDTASLKVFSKDKIQGLKSTIEEQGQQYRKLTYQNLSNHRNLDSLAVGGDMLHDVLLNGASPEVKAAFAAAYPQEAQHISFEDAVRSLPDDHLPGLISAVKGKLFEMKYADYLNDGNLPDGYYAELAHSATQPGWDISIHGTDGHIASLLQLKATDSVDYVQHALDRYPDIDIVTTDEVYSRLVMNGAADHVMHSGMTNSDITHVVSDSVDNAAIHMHWHPPVISLALIAFTAYTLEDADAYGKARHFGERSGKSYLAYLIGGGVASLTQTWWLGMLAGIGSRYLASRGRKQREVYQGLKQVVKTNELLLQRLQMQ
jgi:hypothetical protein